MMVGSRPDVALSGLPRMSSPSDLVVRDWATVGMVPPGLACVSALHDEVPR